MNLPLPLNHVFVDYENVQTLDLRVIGTKGVTFTLLLGPQKKKLDVELVEQLVTHAASVEFVRLTSSGRNALDFTLAYYMGRAVAADPGGSFHIVSKDTGYDPLIDHLQSRHIRVRRHMDFSQLTFSATGKAQLAAAEPGAVSPALTSPFKTVAGSGPLARVRAHLCAHATNRPKRRKTLISHLSALLGKQPPATGIESLVDALVAAHDLQIDAKGAVTYTLQKTST